MTTMLSRLSPDIAGDFWGGLAAMLVALPSAIAFGVTIYGPLGGSYAGYGALAGILGATALGLISSTFGGTKRLITAPCAPAAAVLSAFAIEFTRGGASADSVLFLLVAIGLLAGLLQIMFGAFGLGRLIKYMPYPVVSGYLTGVGLVIIGSQVPKFLGVPEGVHFWRSLLAFDAWRWQGVIVGAATVIVMLSAPRPSMRVPAAILGLSAGIASYFGLGLLDAKLLVIDDNSLIVGPMSASSGLMEAFASRFNVMAQIGLAQLQALLMPALTLAVLLSIDTLKTCVVLDALTRSRHNSNRELIGQGLGNIASGLVGGIPGAGTMGATLVNMSSGAASRLSGVVEGVLALITFLILGSLVAWVPVAALAGILIVVGVRMIDRHSLALLKSRHTILDFAVIAAVVALALFVGLIPAAGAGIVLAIMLFVREQVSTSILRRRIYGNQSFSKQIRPLSEMEILASLGDQSVIFELQGSLFFGTTDQLYTLLEPEVKTRKFIVLDMRRVQTFDVTAAHMLDQIREMMAEKNGFLVYAHLPRNLPSGRDLQGYFGQVGLAPHKSAALIFDDVDEAKEWIENQILQEVAVEREEEIPLELPELEVFKGRKVETLAALESQIVKVSHKAGDKIFSHGSAGDELYIVRRGFVRFMLPVSDTQSRHLSTCGRGAFFGELAFLDGAPRTADAIAFTDVDLFKLSRASFDAFAEEHKKVAAKFFEGLASVLTGRLRRLTTELQALNA